MGEGFSIRKLALFVFILAGSSPSIAAPQLPCKSVAEYRALLEHVTKQVSSEDADIDEVIASVPAECAFAVNGKSFQFPNAQLHADLMEIKSADEEDLKSSTEDLQKNIALRVRGLDSFAEPVDTSAKPKLQQIFTRKEFKNVGKQGAEEAIREQLLKLLIALFSLIAKNPEQATFMAEVFAWSVLGVVTVLVLWKLYRWATRERPSHIPREVIPFAPSAKSYQQWLREAKTAVEKGEFREAVHLSYWAAISHLEASGAWKPDKARTPREYLRLIARSDPARPLLSEISGIFEIVWYGERTPKQSECEAFLARVEQIACR